MDHTKPHQPYAPGSTSEMAQDDDNKAINTIRAVLSKEVATETASFMIDASVCFFTILHIDTAPQALALCHQNRLGTQMT